MDIKTLFDAWRDGSTAADRLTLALYNRLGVELKAQATRVRILRGEGDFDGLSMVLFAFWKTMADIDQVLTAGVRQDEIARLARVDDVELREPDDLKWVAPLVYWPGENDFLLVVYRRWYQRCQQEWRLRQALE